MNHSSIHLGLKEPYSLSIVVRNLSHNAVRYAVVNFFQMTKKGIKIFQKAKNKINKELREYLWMIEKCKEQKMKRMYSANHSYW